MQRQWILDDAINDSRVMGLTADAHRAYVMLLMLADDDGVATLDEHELACRLLGRWGIPKGDVPGVYIEIRAAGLISELRAAGLVSVYGAQYWVLLAWSDHVEMRSGRPSWGVKSGAEA